MLAFILNQECLLFFGMVFKVLAMAVKQEEDMKSMQIGEKEIKLFLFTDGESEAQKIRQLCGVHTGRKDRGHTIPVWFQCSKPL